MKRLLILLLLLSTLVIACKQKEQTTCDKVRAQGISLEVADAMCKEEYGQEAIYYEPQCVCTIKPKMEVKDGTNQTNEAR